MKTRAAITVEANKPLVLEEADLEGLKADEVLMEIKATEIRHMDANALEGKDSEGVFSSIQGHEGAGIVRELEPGVINIEPGANVAAFGLGGIALTAIQGACLVPANFQDVVLN